MKKVIIMLGVIFLSIGTYAERSKVIINTELWEINNPLNSTNYIVSKNDVSNKENIELKTNRTKKTLKRKRNSKTTKAHKSEASSPKFIVNTGLGEINTSITKTEYVTSKKIEFGILNEVYNKGDESIVIGTLYSIDIYGNKKLIEAIKWSVNLKKTFKPKHAVFIGGTLSVPIYVNINKIALRTPGYGVQMGYEFKTNKKIGYRLKFQLQKYKINGAKSLINQSLTAGITYSI
jgi:hypothetical protein